jgi:hypothetical protein
MLAFPHTFIKISAEIGTVISIEICTEIGEIWSIVKKDKVWR